jgi:hypothetical protein
MNYYSDQEIEKVIEEGDRQPLPATSHVALLTESGPTPRRDRTGLWAAAFGVTAFLFVLLANIVQLPSIVLASFAGVLISVAFIVIMKGEKNV